MAALGRHVNASDGKDSTLREVEIRHVRLLGKWADGSELIAFMPLEVFHGNEGAAMFSGYATT